MQDCIEFYNSETNKLVAIINSTMVPTIEAFINIQKQTWQVINITYALDTDDFGARRMRANIDLIKK